MPTLDNRGLEPPEPLVRVLTALGELAVGEELEVLGDRPPIFLYPLLEERGFIYATAPNPDGGVIIRIRRRT